MKKIVSFLGVASFALALVACGGSSKSDSTMPKPASDSTAMPASGDTTTTPPAADPNAATPAPAPAK